MSDEDFKAYQSSLEARWGTASIRGPRRLAPVVVRMAVRHAFGRAEERQSLLDDASRQKASMTEVQNAASRMAMTDRLMQMATAQNWSMAVKDDIMRHDDDVFIPLSDKDA